MQTAGRNDPCPCGSGKKYKKCCAQKSATQKMNATVLSSEKSNLFNKISQLQANQTQNAAQKSLKEKIVAKHPSSVV